MTGLSHLDAEGRASMVDVGAKVETQRQAVAEGRVHLAPATLELIVAGGLPKGDVLATARLAGIMAAKRTADLIPLCHPLPLTHVAVDFAIDAAASVITITGTARTTGRTGVEMEALTAVTLAGLTLYDMVKAVDRAVTLDGVRLIAKSGGKSGDWTRQP